MTFSELWDRLVDILIYPLPVGSIKVTLLGVAQVGLLLVGILVAEHILRRQLTTRVLGHTRLDPGLQFGIARILGYLFIGLSFYIVIQQTGIDLSSLAIFAGAVGLGLGFGLQNIISNFVSGIIILAERPIALGNRVEVNGIAGQVVQINLRSTVVTTSDNISIIVPNSDFLTKPVTNWSYGDPSIRLRLPVGVAYGTDVERFRRVMLEVVSRHPATLKTPEPNVFFVGFGESALDFEVGVWTVEMNANPRRFRSDLYYLIEQALRDNQISIPFPQRDLHLISSQVDLGTRGQ